MKTTAYVATSLDGYLADSSGGVDWLNEIPNPEQSDYGFEDFMDRIDAILMGSNTFRFVQSLGAWPYKKNVYVLSHSLKEVPPGYEDRIRLARGSIRDVLDRIQKESGPRVYVDGGSVIQSCLAAQCLSELIVTTIPIVLGKGIPLFAPSDQRIPLRHRSTEVLGIGLVKSTYDVHSDPRESP